MGENLGQHFLKDGSVLADIIAAAELRTDERILEIGPGMGALTRELLKAEVRVTAVEKDPKLFSQLKHTFKAERESDQLELINEDIRDTDFPKLSNNKNYEVVANIPYYLTSELLVKLLESKKKPDRIVLLVQLDVAERIIAADSKESRLSLLVKSYATPEILRSVPPKSFDPPPKVDSAVLVLTNISDNFFADIEKEKFQNLTKRGFLHKRKTLANNLKSSPDFDKTTIKTALAAYGLKENIRAERLSLNDWKNLLKELVNY